MKVLPPWFGVLWCVFVTFNLSGSAEARYQLGWNVRRCFTLNASFITPFNPPPPPPFSSTGLENLFSNVVMYFLKTFLVRVKLWGKWNHCYSSPTLLSSCVSEKQILRCSVNHFPSKMKCRFKDSLDLYRVQQISSILELKTTFYGLTNTFFYTMRITEQSWNSKKLKNTPIIHHEALFLLKVFPQHLGS